jgi:DNA polymerase I
MQIELRKGLFLNQGSYHAVVAPEPVLVSAINSSAELQRFLFLYIGGNYSRILDGINRSSKTFDVRRAFTAHQLYKMLQDAAHTIIVIEHDPTLFDGADAMLPAIAGVLRDAGREAMVVLYTPVMDRTFSALAQQADRIIEIKSMDNQQNLRQSVRQIHWQRHSGPLVKGQCRLEVA